jgi:excinuclease ABC subunit B
LSGGDGENGAFRLRTDLVPTGDQPEAIESLTSWIESGARDCVLLGVTGSGKTFTMAQVIARTQKPTLVIAPNKTLAAQLFEEFRVLFPDNAVEYFVSYYDYYQPEAYLPASDTYIEKDASINERIDRLRHSATRALLSRRDVIIVASVSCIYGLGSPDAYEHMTVSIRVGQEVQRDQLLRDLTTVQYRRRDFEFDRGSFRVRGDVIDIFPVYEEDRVVRVEMFGDEIEGLYEIDSLTGVVQRELPDLTLFPASHYVTPKDRLDRALDTIEEELDERLEELNERLKPLEAHRLEQRTRYDLEILREVGFCPGIENYSRHLDGRRAGEPPFTLLDYFPADAMILLDESHVTVPQLGGMYRGDRSRKTTLVDFGFRLPSALDNRPLRFEEFQERARQIVYVSATPGDYELERSEDRVTELIIRPTGLVDPRIEIRPVRGQVDDLLGEIRARAARKERVLVTTLTKRMAEDLTEYYIEQDVRVRYMHADVDTLERSQIIRDLRLGRFDVLVGINLLREGLDLPEVSLVAILDADREGFLRSTRSLIQTCGRAARNVEGTVLMYADTTTGSMERALAEMGRRREKQEAHNEEHGITPRSVRKAISNVLSAIYEADDAEVEGGESEAALDPEAIRERIRRLRAEMKRAAAELMFERAAELRDEILRLEEAELARR